MLQFADEREFFTFDDVLLVPQYNEVKSRTGVSLKTGGHLDLSLPILSANMDTVTEAPMAIAIAQSGGLGIIHRFMPKEKLHHEVMTLREAGINKFALSIGVNSREQMFQALELNPSVICIDVAHGHSKVVSDLISELVKHRDAFNLPNLKIIAGNVATREGVRLLADSGADIIKVGIGPGSLCSTRIVTGHGVPQLSAIDACSEEADILTGELGRPIEIIADGGIRNSGDIAKALAAGADYVMLGSLLAATDEAPGPVFKIDGRKYKQYRGMASREVQRELGKSAAAEGVASNKEIVGPVSDVLRELEGGLRSAFTYSGASDIVEFKQNAKFIRVTPNSYVEGTPHGLHALHT